MYATYALDRMSDLIWRTQAELAHPHRQTMGTQTCQHLDDEASSALSDKIQMYLACGPEAPLKIRALERRFRQTRPVSPELTNECVDNAVSKKTHKMERPEVLLTLTVACLYFQDRRQFACYIAVVLGYCGFLVFVSTLTITAEVKETLQSLEPAFENLLRTANLYEDVNALSTRLDGGRPGEVRERHISRRRGACARRTHHHANLRLCIPHEQVQAGVRPAHSRDAITGPIVLRSLRRKVSRCITVPGDPGTSNFTRRRKQSKGIEARVSRQIIRLLAQMRQPTLHADQKESTFAKFRDELLSEKNFLLEREAAGTKRIVPNWTHCLEYEFQSRKQTLRVARGEGQPIERARWSVYNNPNNMQ